MKKVPTLTSNTLKMCRAVPYDPLFTRYEKEIERSRQELLAKVEQTLKRRQELEQKELDEMHDYHERTKLKKSRTATEFFEESERWKRTRQ